MTSKIYDLGDFQYLPRSSELKVGDDKGKKNCHIELSEENSVEIYKYNKRSNSFTSISTDSNLYNLCLKTKKSCFKALSDLARDMFIPRRTHNAKEITKELFIPLTRRFSNINDGLPSLVFTGIVTIIFDTILFPIRLLTLIPRVIYVKNKTDNHPLSDEMKKIGEKDLEYVIVKCQKTWKLTMSDQYGNQLGEQTFNGEYEWRVDFFETLDTIWESFGGKSYALESNFEPKRVVLGSNEYDISRNFDMLNRKPYDFIRKEVSGAKFLTIVLEKSFKTPKIKYIN